MNKKLIGNRVNKIRFWCPYTNGGSFQDDFFLDSEGQVMEELDDLECGGTYISRGCESIIPCMYTGLKDKNGKDLYEGDVVNHAVHRFTGTVVINEFRTLIKDTKGRRHNAHKLPESEIIGNIFENPELL